MHFFLEPAGQFLEISLWVLERNCVESIDQFWETESPSQWASQMSPLTSLGNVLYGIVYKSFTSFVTFIPKYLILSMLCG